MLLIVVYYRRCGRDLRAKLYTAINSLSANHAYLKTLCIHQIFAYVDELPVITDKVMVCVGHDYLPP